MNLGGKAGLRRMFNLPVPYTTPGIGDDIERRKKGLLGLTEEAEAAPLLGQGEAASLFRPAPLDFAPDDMRRNVTEASEPRPDANGMLPPELAALVGEEPRKRKAGWREILGRTLAVLGDAAARNEGYRGGAVDRFADSMGDRRSAYQKALADYEDRRRMAALPGMTTREMAAYMADPKAWGSHMADAATSRYQAATLNPGDQRFLGEGNGVYQAPTRGQQFARSLGLPEGSDQYNTALRDQELGAQGPTAFGNATELEQLRQSGRIAMESARQAGRQTLRGMPTYRDKNPPPPRPPAMRGAPRKAKRPTATGPNGQRVEWDGRAWVPVR